MPFDFNTVEIVITPEQRAERLKNAIVALMAQSRTSQEINEYISGDKFLKDCTEQDIANVVAQLQQQGVLGPNLNQSSANNTQTP